ncbi:hypothetical protein PTKIN_Ptkin02bG0159400 [Pterospermum kingtungense]
MAPKARMNNKKKQALPKKEANSTVSWPDLPQKLIAIIAKQPAMMQYISNGGLTKLCRASTSGRRRQFEAIGNSLLVTRRVVISSQARNCFGKKCSVMVLIGTSHPAFLFYRGGRDWEKQDCTFTEPHGSMKIEGKNFITFTNAIGLNGRFYGLGLQGTLAVIDAAHEPYPRIIAFSSERVVPSLLAKHFREYLLESEGNILLVFLISRKSIKKLVDDVEVYQLNTEKLSWVKMTSLGNRNLVLGD